MTECGLNVLLREHVHGAPDDEVREAFRADANGLAVVDEGDGRPLDGAGDRRGFAVIEGVGSRPADEAREVQHAHVPELGMLDELLFD